VETRRGRKSAQTPLQQGVKRQSHPLPTRAIQEAALGSGCTLPEVMALNRTCRTGLQSERRSTRRSGRSLRHFPTAPASRHRSGVDRGVRFRSATARFGEADIFSTGLDMAKAPIRHFETEGDKPPLMPTLTQSRFDRLCQSRPAPSGRGFCMASKLAGGAVPLHPGRRGDDRSTDQGEDRLP
jgi:hypothetical protein